jgi:signal peptidase I
MKHTFHNEDKLIISNLFYQPETGDIVVLNPESHGERNEPIIKRVIATAGQTVYIDYEKWEVYVDGQKLDEPYIEEMKKETQAIMGKNISMRHADDMKYNSEFVVGEGKIFVMGDNRNNSKDSRSREYGEINENRILGRVVIRLAPNFGFVE